MPAPVRSALAAALLLTGASAAMAASDAPGTANQTVQTSAPATATASSAPVASQADKPRPTGFSDKADAYGGHAPESQQGVRAFWQNQNPY